MQILSENVEESGGVGGLGMQEMVLKMLESGGGGAAKP
jgi:hypothetical protein